jgi:hypothetical protein
VGSGDGCVVFTNASMISRQAIADDHVLVELVDDGCKYDTDLLARIICILLRNSNSEQLLEKVRLFISQRHLLFSFHFPYPRKRRNSLSPTKLLWNTTPTGCHQLPVVAHHALPKP